MDILIYFSFIEPMFISWANATIDSRNEHVLHYPWGCPFPEPMHALSLELYRVRFSSRFVFITVGFNLRRLFNIYSEPMFISWTNAAALIQEMHMFQGLALVLFTSGANDHALDTEVHRIKSGPGTVFMLLYIKLLG